MEKEILEQYEKVKDILSEEEFLNEIEQIRPNYEDLPLEAKEYIEFIEKEVNCKITYISVGPERESIIIRNKKEKSNYE